MNVWGLSEGWFERDRSEARVGALRITSQKGLSASGRLSPPVFHFLRLSSTRPSHGLRKSAQGSKAERGITVTFVLFMTQLWWPPLIGLGITALGVINWAYEPV